MILYSVSTLPGQSGSAVIEVKGKDLRMVGVHKGGFQIKVNGNIIELNAGRLITKDMLKTVQAQAVRMGAQMFRIHQSAVTAADWFTRGQELLNKKQYPQAAQCYRTELIKDTTDFKIYRQLGYCLNQMKKYDEAILNYRKAITLNKYDTQTHAQLGYSLNQTKRYEEAIKQFRRADSLGLKTAPNYYNLGIALSETKRFTQAIDSYRRAIEINPNLSQAYYNLGVKLYTRNKIEEAIASYGSC